MIYYDLRIYGLFTEYISFSNEISAVISLFKTFYKMIAVIICKCFFVFSLSDPTKKLNEIIIIFAEFILCLRYFDLIVAIVVVYLQVKKLVNTVPELCHSFDTVNVFLIIYTFHSVFCFVIVKCIIRNDITVLRSIRRTGYCIKVRSIFTFR